MRRPHLVVSSIAAAACLGVPGAASALPRAFVQPTPPPGWADCGIDFQTIFVSGSVSCAEGFQRMDHVKIMSGSEGVGVFRTKDPFVFEDMTCRGFYEPDGIGGEVPTAAGCVAPGGQIAQSVDQRQLRTAARLARIGLTAASGRRPAFCPVVRSRGRTVEHLQQGLPCAKTAKLVARFRVRSRPEDGGPRRESYRSGSYSCYLLTGAATVSGGRYLVAGRCERGADVGVRFAISRRATRAERRAVR